MRLGQGPADRLPFDRPVLRHGNLAEDDPPPGRLLEIVIIDSRKLLRDCLASAIEAHDRDIRVARFASLDDWLTASPDLGGCDLLVYCQAGPPPRAAAECPVPVEIRQALPVVVLSEGEDPGEILAALEQGVRGYISTNVTIEVAVEALHLVSVGGTYVPVSSLLGSGRGQSAGTAEAEALARFTSRQAAVLKALRQGKANKLIAYELNMCESTVKVHVRNIMRKLKARNRTEVAFKTNAIFPDKDGD